MRVARDAVHVVELETLGAVQRNPSAAAAAVAAAAESNMQRWLLLQGKLNAEGAHDWLPVGVDYC